MTRKGQGRGVLHKKEEDRELGGEAMCVLYD